MSSKEADELKGERLATIVHISDLHFGDSVDGVPALDDSVASQMWQFHPVMDGWLGHSAAALQLLPERVLSLVKREGAYVVATGDLTATGSNAQVAFGFQYLEGFHEQRLGQRLGLALSTLRKSTIPGNHDTWRGSRGFGGRDVGAIRKFEATPLDPHAHSIPLGKSRSLVVYGIFTDADVSPNSWRRVLGRGLFDNQLKDLTRTLGKRPEREIRALLLHHSPMDGIDKICGISRSSRTLLERVAAELGFSVLLTGHKHSARGYIHGWTTAGVFEARCGTTTARDEVPHDWYLALDQHNRLAKNTFLVHRLIEAGDGVLHWTTEVNQRNATGFRDIYPLPGTDSHPVWQP